MNLKDFQFQLPDELLAQYPAPSRTESRLLKYNKSTNEVIHSQVMELPAFLRPGDLLVFNDTRVLTARLITHKSTGGRVEILVEKVLDAHRAYAHLGSSKPVRVGQILYGKNFQAEVLEKQADRYLLLFQGNGTIVLDILKQEGLLPLPPYMNRAAEALDHERYQTVFANEPGAIAAPTAGLHFDQNLLNRIQEQGVKIGFITLHVGTGTFKPVRVENIEQHVMSQEHIEVSPEICDLVNETKAAGNRVIAVGTTVVRALESAWSQGMLRPTSSDTGLFIYEGFRFQCVDELMTNFHLPGSTLLMLVSAFAGREKVLELYQMAIAKQYRFYSYGDLMYISK